MVEMIDVPMLANGGLKMTGRKWALLITVSLFLSSLSWGML
jgi:hypothetical protein